MRINEIGCEGKRNRLRGLIRRGCRINVRHQSEFSAQKNRNIDERVEIVN